MPTMLQDRPTQDSGTGMRVPGGRHRRVPFRLVAAGAALALLVPAGLGVRDWTSGWGNPLEQEVVDRSTPALLLALEDMSQYHAASADLQVMVDLEVDTPWVPSVISGERVNFLATGSADAYVDFDALDDGAVTLSPDGESARIVLPAPELAEVRIDPEESRVVDRDRGLVERIGGAFAENPVDDTELYALAEDRLSTAAAASDLRERAETNTGAMLTGLARSLGVEEVEVRFDEPADVTG
jgi:Protein of unknown function (DUF4230)